jgi:hypothetical protein
VKCLYVETSNSDNSKSVYKEWETLLKGEPVQIFIIPGEEIQ